MISLLRCLFTDLHRTSQALHSMQPLWLSLYISCIVLIRPFNAIVSIHECALPVSREAAGSVVAEANKTAAGLQNVQRDLQGYQ